MTRLLIQQFLENHSFKELQEQYGVYASFDKSGKKFSLNYDQIEAKDSDQLSQECRGLILSTLDYRSFNDEAKLINGRLNFDHVCPKETVIIAYPFKRFFNYGQGAAFNIQWNDPKLKIFSKIDGTCTILYFCKVSEKWCVATRSSPEADIPLEYGLYTFRTLFEKALKDMLNLSFDEYTSNLDKEITYLFELCSPFNQVVIKYPNTVLTFLGARTNSVISNYEELDISKVNVFGIPHAPTYTHMSVNDLVNLVSSLNPLEHEGVVVCDSNFNRIKIKNPAYVAYSKAKDMLGHSERNCLELILLGKEDDIIPHLPIEIVENLNKIKIGAQKLIKRYDALYLNCLAEANSIKENDKKTFAIHITKNKDLWHAPFFQIYDKKAENMLDFINKNKKDGTWSNSFLDKILEIIDI